MKIVITDAATVTSGDVDLNVFSEFGELEIYPLTSKEQLDDRISDADIVLCNKTVIDDKTMKKAKKLRYIGLFATGYNNIDVVYAKNNGITVCNAPSYSTDAVAQHTIALLLQVANKVGEYNNTVLQGDWIKSSSFSYFPLPLIELNEKTIGIIGYGAIGKKVAKIAMSFGMKVLVCNRSKINDSSVTQVDFDTLLKNSDVVSLHCPLNEDSKGIMNRDAFFKMKDGAIFINTARGPIVDEIALKEALESGKLSGAGIDVLCVEPMNENCPLYKAKNCFITPHIAWAGIETRERLMKIVSGNIKAFLENSPRNVVG